MNKEDFKFKNKVRTIKKRIHRDQITTEHHLYALDKKWDTNLYEDELEFFNQNIKQEDIPTAIDLLNV
jgi:hypothetical protein